MELPDYLQNSEPTRGLSDSEVAESRRLFGDNVLTPPEKESLWHKFFGKLKDPLIIILLIAGVLSLGISFYEYFGLDKGTSVFFEPVGIFIAIILATGLAFFFELKADKEFTLLNTLSDDDAVTVVRNSSPLSVPKKDVVTGDIILLSPGQEIPADAVLIDTRSMNVDESTLTGEPIAHKSSLPELADSDATFPSDHVMRGTKVMEGHGTARVTAVGDNTENGRVYQAAQIDNSVKTPLSEQLDRLGQLISDGSYIIAGLIIVAKLMLFFNWAPISLSLIVPTGLLFYMVICRFPHMKGSACIATLSIFFIIFIAMVLGVNRMINGASDISELLAYTLQTIMIAVTLIVVAVPEGLPMAITLSLAYSMRRMLKTNNLVRKMHACETMGATTVICTDKTGTLTQNRMQVKDSLFAGQPDGSLSDSIHALAIAINSTAQLSSIQDEAPEVLGNPTEGALLLWLHSMGYDYKALRKSVTVTDEIPFSTERKFMASIVSTPNGERYLFVKGAPEIVLDLCSTISLPCSADDIKQKLYQWQNRSMRTLGFASAKLADSDEPFTDGRITCNKLRFEGITAIADPVRSDVPDAIAECRNAGIDVKIVTGDTPATATEIARQIGLWTGKDTAANIITGPEFGQLSDAELDTHVNDIKIIARARPLDKKRLVESLQRIGQVVAVTGDGTNDAPALKAAHVGLSMGDGTSVAKEASDITIIDNSFASIGRAVMWGRSLYRNIQRFILFQMTVNVAACLIVLAGAFMGTESPLTVTQMLWVNLIMDTFAAMALASLPPSASVMNDKPRKRSEFIITRSMTNLIVITGLIVFAIMFAMVYTFQHSQVNTLTDLLHIIPGASDTLSAYELSIIFTTFVFLQFWNIFNARAFATGRSAFHLGKCGEFLFIAALIFFGQIAIVELGGEFFNVTPLSLRDWLIIIIGTSPILIIGELLRLFHKKTIA